MPAATQYHQSNSVEFANVSAFPVYKFAKFSNMCSLDDLDTVYTESFGQNMSQNSFYPL